MATATAKVKVEATRRLADEKGELKDKGDIFELNKAAAKKLQDAGAVKVVIE